MQFDLLPELQLFAEGGAADGAGVTGADAGPQTGVTGPDAGAGAETSEQQPISREAAFEQMIRGEYKDLYSRRVQDTVRSRLKATEKTVAAYQALTPTLELLAKRYGVDAGDAKALSRAIEDDDSLYESEASERGLTVEQLKDIRKLERDNESLRAQIEQRNAQAQADQIYNGWLQQADEVKGIYPAFDLRSELQNEQFTSLLRSGIDVRTAYEVMHRDEIIPAVMQITARQAEAKVAQSVASNASRPREAGLSGSSTPSVKVDVAHMTKEQRHDLIRRAQLGERIVL